ncbi:hypothetical protein [Amycolatopsis oliviviridis]
MVDGAAAERANPASAPRATAWLAVVEEPVWLTRDTGSVAGSFELPDERSAEDTEPGA